MARRRGGKQEFTGDETKLVQFKLGDESFGVKVEQIREIVKIGNITSVPKMPSFIEGVMNLRGQITTIIDLRRRFDIIGDGGGTYMSRIIVAEIGESQVGIIVDSVKDVIRVSPQTISPPPKTISSKVDARFLTGICRHQNGLLMLLDLDNLFSDEEIEGLDNIDLNEGMQNESKDGVES
ncbi:MAG: chemotaxis protein CheW [Thermoplasmatota archaeon]